MTLTDVLPTILKLPALDKLKLIRILAEELESAKDIFPFDPNKTYHLATPYDSFGSAQVLAEALAEYEANETE